MRFGVIGPVVVWGGRAEADLGGRVARAVLALLVARHPAGAPRDWLEDQVWHGARTSDSALRVQVLRLRRALAEVGVDGAIRTTPNGYVLDLGDHTAESDIDLHRFESLVDQGIAARSRHRPREARALLTDALELWRGDPFEGLDVEALEPVRRHLERRRVDALEHLAASTVETGDHDTAIRLLDGQLERHLDRESLAAISMLASMRAGRPADALRTAERLRRSLRDEFGVPPGTDVLAIETWARGGDEPVAVVTTLLRAGLSSGATNPASRPVPGRLERLTSSPLLGRDAELARAEERLVEPATGAVVCVAGEAGIGKTRFLGELAARAHRAGRHVVFLTCRPAGDDGHEVLAELVRHLLEHGDPGHDLVALGDEPLEARPADLVAEAVVRRARLLAAVDRQFERLDRRPVFVVVDDVQWLGEASLRFILDLVAEGGRTQWAVGWRSTISLDDRPEMAPLISSPSVLRIDLAPLAPAAITELADGLLGPGGQGDAVPDVVARAGGNPLFAYELARFVAAGGDPRTAPPDLRRIVRRSIDALGEDALRVARLAALVHPGYPSSVLMRLAVRSDEAAEALDSLQRVGVLESVAGDRWQFRHPLVEQAVVDDVGDAVRARLHLELAGALTDEPSAVVAASAHLVDAGALADPALRDHTVARALEQLIASGIFETAVPLARRWRDVAATSSAVTAERVRASIAAGTALLAANDTVAALTLLDAARREAEQVGDPELRCDAELARGPLGAVRMTRSRIDALVELADQLDPADSRRRIELYCWAAHHAVIAGDAAHGRALVDRAFEIDPAGRGVAMDALLYGIRFHTLSGPAVTPAESAAAYDDLVRLEADSHSPPLTAMVHLFGMTQSLRFADAAAFRRHVDALRDEVTRIPRPDLTWWIDAGDACLAVATGAPDAAAVVTRAASTANRLHVTHGQSAAALQHALLAWDAGTFGVLRPLLSHELTPTDPARWFLHVLACVESGDLDAARRGLADFAPVPLGSLGEMWSPVAALLGTAVFATGDLAWAASLHEQLEPLAGTALSMHGMAYLGAVDAQRGRCAAVLGDVGSALHLLAAGAALDDRMGAVHFAARARRDAAHIESWPDPSSATESSAGDGRH